MQQEGDVLYVPSGWYQGQVTCGQALTISATLPSAAVFPADQPWDPELAGEESYVVPFEQGMAAVKQGQHDAALPLLREAARRTKETNDVVLYNLGRVLGHIDGAAGQRPEEAVRVLHKCTEINPLNAKCWLYICVSFVQLQEMHQVRAEEIYPSLSAACSPKPSDMMIARVSSRLERFSRTSSSSKPLLF